VLRDALMFVGLGLVAGIPLALGTSVAVRSYLFDVEPRDVATLVAASAVVLIAATAAAYIPARLAPKVDPMLALRAE
jgi:ABC-type antimicrobial peptide transport system permease subunit